MKSKFLFFFLIALSTSCSSDYSPKPRGYFYIELPKPIYRDFVRYPFFKCSISNQMIVKELKNESQGGKKNSEIGFNLNYPRLHAQIFCSYRKIIPSDFLVLSETDRRTIDILKQKAKGVTEAAYSHPEQKVYGQMYEIQGNPVSPIQFVISDSTHSYFKGILYFDTVLDRDSIAPVLAYITKDVQVMIESFQWKQ